MKNLRRILNKHHLKATIQRLTILNIIKTQKRPSSIQDLLSIFETLKPKIDKVTIYRIIEKLLEKNIIRQIDFHDNKIRYELNNDHHHHLVCKICGRIQAIHKVCLSIDVKEIMSQYEFSVEEHSLEFFGICRKCLKTKNVNTVTPRIK